MIRPKVRDPRMITLRRGGRLRDDDHHLLAHWAADCAEHVLHHVEQVRPNDRRPGQAIDLARAWAAADAILAARAAVARGEGQEAGRLECRWQRAQLPPIIRDLVLDDQRSRNELCWYVIDC